jgi:hypothetical protein
VDASELDRQQSTRMDGGSEGLLDDLRTMRREVQEVAFARGIIPFIPADRD